MVALWNRADHYIFMRWFVLSSSSFFFFSSPNLSSRRLDVYHTSVHGVVLVLHTVLPFMADHHLFSMVCFGSCIFSKRILKVIFTT